MFVSSQFLCYVVLLVDVVRVESSVEFTQYLTRVDRKLKVDRVVEQHILRNQQECVLLCESQSFCKGAAWGTLERICQLTDRKCVDNGEDNGNLEAAGSWLTMAESKYPVAVYKGPSGRYTLSFAEAQSLCAQLDSVIASPSDLLLARSIGYEACNCGWLSDGTSGFVLQNVNYTCWGSFSTEIILCAGYYSLVDVYCHAV